MKAVLFAACLSGFVAPAWGAPQEELQSRSESMPGGRYRQEVLVRRSGVKYPLRRCVETGVVDPVSGRTHVLKRSESIGDHIIVKLQSGVDLSDLERLNRQHGAYTRRTMLAPRTFLVAAHEPDLDCVDHLGAAYTAASNIVAYAEPDPVIHLQDTIPDDPYYTSGQLWGHERIQCAKAWDIEQGTGGVVIAVIDTGVDYNHVDLASNMWVNPGESGVDSNGVGLATNGVDDDANGFIDDVYGWDFYNDDHDPWDGHGHGSRCAGHFGAVGNNGLGVVGVCWNIRIMALKLYSDEGELSATPASDAIDCFSYVSLMRSNGVNVRITSNSWGADYSIAMEEAVRRNRDLGILCMAAAGNKRLSIDEDPVYPACFNLDNVISVGGTDGNDALYISSSTSGSNFGVTNVDLAAPAVDIWSTETGSTYKKSTGTSRSAPFTAGVAALVWELAPLLSHQQVRQALLDGVDVIPALQGKVATGGRLNAYGALLNIPPVIVHDPLINTTNQVDPYVVTARIQPRLLLGTNAPLLRWSTDIDTNVVITNSLTWVTNDWFIGTIPAQPLGTEIAYYLSAETTNGLETLDPTNAPLVSHTFRVVEPVWLDIEGVPARIGSVSPGYGGHSFPSGIVVNLSAEAWVPVTNGIRYGQQGWVGAGDVPGNGSSNAFAITVTQPSTCQWVWATEYALEQAASVTGLLDAVSWWVEFSTGQTVTAPLQASWSGTNYRFTGWTVDGVRQPDASSPAVNPATAIAMTTSRLAEAFYMAGSTDSDLDSLPDYWEFFYFGNLDLTATNDPDGDLAPNGDEQVAGTDPTDPLDLLLLSGFHTMSNRAVLAWPSVSGRTYGVEGQIDLASQQWTSVIGAIPAQVPLNVTTTELDNAIRFYRITVKEE